MSYSFNEHRHNYAVWTAARAVQRNFTGSSTIIRSAIEASRLRAFVEDDKIYSHQDFEAFHMRCAGNITAYLQSRQVKGATYGRAAKIIAIYLKTAVIMCNQGGCEKSEVIHPPVDGILLKNLAELPGLKGLATEKWTILDSKRYWWLAEKIAADMGFFNWRLEEYWWVG